MAKDSKVIFASKEITLCDQIIAECREGAFSADELWGKETVPERKNGQPLAPAPATRCDQGTTLTSGNYARRIY